MIASRSRLAAKATVSVSAEDTGIRPRRKSMLRMIDCLSATAWSAFTTVIITSWNGTTAREAEPGRWAGALEHEGHEQQVDADERERVDEPLHELPGAAAVARAQVRGRQRDEDVEDPGPA